MVANNGLFRIFWPSDAPRAQSRGVLIGWRNSDFDVLVIAILQQVEVREQMSHNTQDLMWKCRLEASTTR